MENVSIMDDNQSKKLVNLPKADDNPPKEDDNLAKAEENLPDIGCSVEELFNSGLGLQKGYAVVAPFGGGKSSLARKEAARIAAEAARTGRPTHLIICVWRADCPDLLEQYKEFAETLATSENLEVKIGNKPELCGEFDVNINWAHTTQEINGLCKAVIKKENGPIRDVFIIVDDIRVQTYQCTATRNVQYRAMQGQSSSANGLVGNIPFIYNGALYPWSKVDPGQVRLLLYVTPESNYLEDRENIKKAPPTQGPLRTLFLTRNLRATQSTHPFLAYLEAKLEAFVRVYGGFLLPPHREVCGSKEEGTIPEWILVKQMPHILCETGCDSCLLQKIRPSLAANLRQLEDKEGIGREDMAIVVLGTSTDEEMERARSWMSVQYPGIRINMDGELEGKEARVVFSIGTFNLDTLKTLISSSLSRSKDRLFLYTNDYKDVLSLASRRNFLKKRDDLSSLNVDEIEPSKNQAVRDRNIKKLNEVMDILVSNAWAMSPESIEQLAIKFGVKDMYLHLMSLDDEPSRGEVLESIFKEWSSKEEWASLFALKIMLRSETVKQDHIVEKIEAALHANLEGGVERLIHLINTEEFTRKKIMDVAYALGFRERYKIFRDNSRKGLTEKQALIRCLETFLQHSPADFSSKELAIVLLKAGLEDVAKMIIVKIESPTAEGHNPSENTSGVEMNPTKPYQMSTFDIAYPLLSLMLTATMLILLMTNGASIQAGMMSIFMFLLPMLTMLFHVLEQNEVYSMTMDLPKIVFTLLLPPVSEIATYVEILHRQNSLAGTAMRKLHINRLIKSAKALKQSNCITSLAVVTFVLVLFNNGDLKFEMNAVSIISMTTGILHIFNLFIAIMRSWLSFNENLSILLLLFPLIISSILRILPPVFLLSGTFVPLSVTMFLYPILTVGLNYFWEVKMKDTSAPTAVDEIKIKPVTWLRAAISFIFPPPPRDATRKSLLAVNLQLLTTNATSLLFVYLAANLVPVQSSWLVPQNLVNSMSITSSLLMLHATVSFVASTFFLEKDDTEEILDDANSEVMEDVLETSTSPLFHHNDALPMNRKRNFLHAAGAAISAIFLLASIATAPLQMLTLFNFCPSLPSSPYSNITCDDSTSSPVVGTICNVNCPVGYPSTAQLESRCSWTGRWTNIEMDCSSTPGLIIIGKSHTSSAKTDQSFAEGYFPTSNVNQTIDPFPYQLLNGVSAYVDGKLLACGGRDGATVRSSCYQLNKDGSWGEALPMPRERMLASSALVDQGSSLWILGGMDSSYYGYSSTIVWKSSSSSWEEGPLLTSIRGGHCTVTMPDGDVLIAGGIDDIGPLTVVERFSFLTRQWSTEAPLRHARVQPVCSHVWMDHSGIALDAYNGEVSGVIVAGGATLDSAVIRHPVTTVELLAGGKWIQLPELPNIHKYPQAQMSLPNGLVWIPGYGVQLVGGCYRNYHEHSAGCTNKVWNLQSEGWAPNITYYWVIQNDKLDTPMFDGNTAASIPSTYFN